jgi:H+/Na+-translocating ferredoxin:NAD+ oxidoreductase subunit C
MFAARRQHRSFAHGIHPPQAKDDTCDLPIRQFPFAPVMIIPLAQHIGKPALATVREGQEVERGQLIAEPDGFVSVAMHAPASGVIQRIDLVPSISGKMVPGIYLKPFPGSSQEVREGTPCDLETASVDDILLAIQQAGIVGLGGAAFPTHVKLKIPDDKHIDTLIINGVECEPYLTTDHRVMVEQSGDIFTGIRYLLKVTGAQRAIIGIEANKLAVAESLRTALVAGTTAGLPADFPVTVEVVEVKYPQGAEKMLISALLDRQVPSGGLPADVNVVSVNVATTAEIGRLLPHGRGIQERVITIGGPAIKNKGNYRIPIGTPLRFALETVGMTADLNRVFLGGPMMGQALPSLDIPITKGTSGFIAFGMAATVAAPEYPCIHCGYCVDACPLFLNPSQLGLLARSSQYQRMTDEFHLMDCFECGSCSYVCPAHIPLVQRFRSAKTMVRKLQAGS